MDSQRRPPQYQYPQPQSDAEQLAIEEITKNMFSYQNKQPNEMFRRSSEKNSEGPSDKRYYRYEQVDRQRSYQPRGRGPDNYRLQSYMFPRKGYEGEASSGMFHSDSYQESRPEQQFSSQLDSYTQQQPYQRDDNDNWRSMRQECRPHAGTDLTQLAQNIFGDELGHNEFAPVSLQQQQKRIRFDRSDTEVVHSRAPPETGMPRWRSTDVRSGGQSQQRKSAAAQSLPPTLQGLHESSMTIQERFQKTQERLTRAVPPQDASIDPWAQVVLKAVKEEVRLRDGSEQQGTSSGPQDDAMQSQGQGPSRRSSLKRPADPTSQPPFIPPPPFDNFENLFIASQPMGAPMGAPPPGGNEDGSMFGCDKGELSQGAVEDEVIGFLGKGKARISGMGAAIAIEPDTDLFGPLSSAANEHKMRHKLSDNASLIDSPIVETHWRVLLEPTSVRRSGSEYTNILSDWEQLDVIPFKEYDGKRGKGGRQPAQDPRQDPNIDPKRAKRILANRLSAARSKERQKRELEDLKACHKMLEYKREAANKELYALQLAINHLAAETEVMSARVTAVQTLGTPLDPPSPRMDRNPKGELLMGV